MKYLTKILAILLLAGSCFSAYSFPYQHNVEFGLQNYHFKYVETDENDQFLDSEEGNLYGLFGSYTGIFKDIYYVNLFGDFTLSPTQYEGSTWGGTPHWPISVLRSPHGIYGTAMQSMSISSRLGSSEDAARNTGSVTVGNLFRAVRRGGFPPSENSRSSGPPAFPVPQLHACPVPP